MKLQLDKLPLATFAFKYNSEPKAIDELLIRYTGNDTPCSSIQLSFITSSIKWKSELYLVFLKPLLYAMTEKKQ